LDAHRRDTIVSSTTVSGAADGRDGGGETSRSLSR